MNAKFFFSPSNEGVSLCLAFVHLNHCSKTLFDSVILVPITCNCTQDFYLGGVGNDQVKKLNNKTQSFKALCKVFLETNDFDRICVLMLGSTPDHLD